MARDQPESTQVPGRAAGGDIPVLALKNATVGVLTALPEEFQAVCTVLGCDQEVIAERTGAGRIYRLGIVRHRANQAAHVVAVSQLLDMGNNNGAIAAVQLVHDCPNVTNIVMCGICGGVPHPTKPVDHVRLGDIVASGVMGVRQYDFVKESEQAIEHRDRPRPPSPELLAGAQQLNADELAGRRPWDRYISDASGALGAGWERPEERTDVLRDPVGPELLRHTVNRIARTCGFKGSLVRYRAIPHPRRDDPAPKVFHGLIASANNLQKNPYRRNHLRDQFGAKAIEMEGSGVADAAYQLTVPYFVVRAVQDYCNEDKNKIWRRYAALAAAAYTRALLEATPPRFFATTPVAPAPLPTVPRDQVASAADSAAAIQGIIVNTLIGDSTSVVVSGGGAGSTANANIGEVKEVRGVQINVSVTFPSPLRPSLASDAAIAASLEGRQGQSGRVTADLTTTPTGQGGSQLERQLLGEEARRLVDELMRAQDTWEFARLFELALHAEAWVERYGDRLEPVQRQELYGLLARIETTRARQQLEPDGRPSFAKARRLLGKAKDERNP